MNTRDEMQKSGDSGRQSGEVAWRGILNADFSLKNHILVLTLSVCVSWKEWEVE